MTYTNKKAHNMSEYTVPEQDPIVSMWWIYEDFCIPNAAHKDEQKI